MPQSSKFPTGVPVCPHDLSLIKHVLISQHGRYYANLALPADKRCHVRPVLAQVYKFNVPTFGPGVVFDVDIKIRTEQIRFFTESLKTSKLQSYVPQFVMEAEVWLLLDPVHLLPYTLGIGAGFC